MEFNLKNLKLPKQYSITNPINTSGISIPTREPNWEGFKKYGPFIDGPIQLWWVIEANKLTKSAMKVALVICFLNGTDPYTETGILLEYTTMKRLGIGREETISGLFALNRAGLIDFDVDSDAIIWVRMLTLCKYK